MDETIDWQKIASRLFYYDSELQIKPDGIDLFNSELLLIQVTNQSRQLEIIWDESREHWIPVVVKELNARKLHEF